MKIKRIAWNKGKKMLITPQWRERMLTNLRIKASGKNHWNWKGGISKNKKHRKELQLKRSQKWAKNNPEKVKISKKKWLKTERGKIYKRLKEQKRRHVSGKCSIDDWQNKLELLKYECQICYKKPPEIELTIDHIVPISRGGTNNIKNLQPLCRGCNSKKSNRLLS